MTHVHNDENEDESDDGNNEDRKNMLLRVAVGCCGCSTMNLPDLPFTVPRSCVLQLFPASVQFHSQQLPSWDPQPLAFRC